METKNGNKLSKAKLTKPILWRSTKAGYSGAQYHLQLNMILMHNTTTAVLIMTKFSIQVAHQQVNPLITWQVVGDDIMQSILLVASSAKEAIQKLQVYVDAGFTEIVITNSSPDRQKMVKLLAKEVIPHFR